MIATHEELPPGATGLVNLMEGSQAGVDVVLGEEAGVLSGTVTRADGTPAVGVELRAFQHLTRVQLTAKTDEHGRYYFSGFAPGLDVAFAGFSDLDSLAGFVPPNKSADIRLPSELVVRGRLTDARTGLPIFWKKRVLLSRDPAWHRGFEGVSAAPSGRFEVKGIWPGKYFLCARAWGYVPTCREVKIEPERCDLGDVPIHRGITLRGAVESADGAPMPNAEVFIHGPQFYDGKTVYSDRNGRYRFKGLAGGSYQFRIRADGWAPFYEKAIELPAKGGGMTKDARLVKGVPLSGHVRHGNKPVTRQIVVLTGCDTGVKEWAQTWIADTNTDETGGFLFPHLAPGEYTVRCGLERRRITVTTGNGLVCDFDWPGRFELPKPEAKSDPGG
ncbi:MAG: carboxypeptidase regulatory-like domain-containing protein [Lentisphaerae bacterium]|nr:carboxypeptidase regulatory-like domain-containing protein [Lentisphaerota bacterium]